MKKSTWKKLFTRSKSKSGTRAAKKGKLATVSCNVCAGVAVINVDTLCSTHRNSQNRNQDAVSPQSAVSTGQSVPSPVQLSSSQNKQTVEVQDNAAESAAAASPINEDQNVLVSGVERSVPVEIPKPQPLARTSTNEEFMTEEVDSHNLSDNSRTEENPVTEAEESNAEKSTSPNELKMPSAAQELKVPSTAQELRVPSGAQEHKKPSETEVSTSQSGTFGLRNRRSGTQVRELASESQGFKAPSQSQTLNNQFSAVSRGQEPSSEAQVSPSNQHGLKTPSNSADDREVVVTQVLNIREDSAGVERSLAGSLEEQSLNVEAKNRKNSLSVADVDLSNIIHGAPAQLRRESQSSGRQEETISSTNNEEFMSEEVTSGASAEGEDAYYPKSSAQVSSAITIAKTEASSSSHHDSNISSNQGLEIVEIDEQDATVRGRRLSMDATNMKPPGSITTTGLKQDITKDSSEDLKPGMLQAQRSSKLNISFSEHVSHLGEKGNDKTISHDSLEPYENPETTTIIETTTTTIIVDTTDVAFNPLRPSGAQDLKTSPGAESEEALMPPPEDDDPMQEADSGMGSEESSTSGPKETAEETNMQQNTADNPRSSPTIIFGTLSGHDPESEWNQPLFFGPNSLAQGLAMNVNNRGPENPVPENQAPFQGFGIISIMRDLYENDSSSSQVQENKVTDVTEEMKKEEEARESGQAPPSLHDEDQEPESFKEVSKKQE